MNRTFEQFLEQECLKHDWHGPKDGFEEYFNNVWIPNRDPEEWIEYAEQWASEQFKNPMNEAYDAIHDDGAPVRAQNILGVALGYEKEQDWGAL